METTTGSFLRELRLARRLSREQAAARAGIARSTLHRWETEQFQPRLPELNVLLIALEATDAQRVRAISLMDAPRAMRFATGNLGQGDTQSEISGGELLRALRRRAGRSMAEAARQIGITQSTLSRWERGEHAPDGADLHTLCFALHASPNEAAALTAQRFLVPIRAGSEAVSAALETEILERRYETLRAACLSGFEDPLADLRVLALEAQINSLTRRHVNSNQAGIWRGETFAVYAQYLYLYGRYADSAAAAQRVLADVTPAINAQPHQWRAAINAARAETASGGSPANGAARLREWLPSLTSRRDDLSRDYLVWVLEMISDFLCQAGYFTEARRFLAQSQHLEEQRKSWITPEGYRNAARLAMSTGKPDEAFPLLEKAFERLTPQHALSADRPATMLLWAEAEWMAGRAAAAQTWLQSACSEMERYRVLHLRPRADRLAQRLNANAF